jgi:hypothetical protein
MGTFGHLAAIPVALAACIALPAAAASYTNVSGVVVELPGGDASFADVLVSANIGLVSDADGGAGPVFFPPGTIVPLPAFRNGNESLGLPDTTSDTTLACGTPLLSNPLATPAACNFVSLGVGGSLTVRFTDNFLTGSDSTADDLWIFEVGPDIEDTFVEVSSDGLNWTSVGKVFGSTLGVDIDAFGFDSTSLLSYVRLTDDPAEGETDGGTVGADIDAIGAISTTVVPAPPAAWLLLTGVVALAARRFPRG